MFGPVCDHTEEEETLIVHCGRKIVVPPGEVSVDAVPAIHVASSYLFDSAESLLDVSKGGDGYVYRRLGNENCMDLSLALAQLEGASQALCLSTGMAAISSAFIAAGILDGGKRVLGPYSCYGSTYTLLRSRFTNISTCEFTDLGDTVATLENIHRLKPDILYLETSSNPLTIIPDIATLIAAARIANPTVITMIDNTYATPLLVKPLSLGVDVVLHSLTKYINGHGDALAGAIVSSNASFMDSARAAVVDFGGALSPWDAWLVLRGLRTLGVRMDAIGRNALAVARHLEALPTVARIFYPGLPSHPQFAAVMASSLRQGKYSEAEISYGFPFSGMIAFDISVPEDRGEAAAQVFLQSMGLVANQVSLGDVKTLASAPGLSTQHQIPPEERRRIGIRTTTIRLSVGLEAVSDICADVEQALRAAVAATGGEAAAPGADALIPDQHSDATTAGASVGAVASASANVNVNANTDVVFSTESSLASRATRLSVLYTQMAALSAEAETLQKTISGDTLKPQQLHL